ncbi:MAG: hypothetical protein ACJ8CR_16325 [Roseiflexaceae bacterium]
MFPAMLEQKDAAEAQALVPVQPFVDRVWVTRLQEPLSGNRVRRLPIGDFQQGSAAFAHIWARVMIAILDQVLALGVGQF